MVTQDVVSEFVQLPVLINILEMWDVFDVGEGQEETMLLPIAACHTHHDQPASSTDSSVGEDPYADHLPSRHHHKRDC